MRTHLVPCLFLICLGCEEAARLDTLPEDGLCAANVWYQDADGDGWGTDSRLAEGCKPPGALWSRQVGDCDDGDVRVHPEGIELANGVDDDCNGIPDDGTPLHDHDGDGFCGPDVARCTTPGTIPGDCDDTDPDIRPGALERCNGLDDDCDGRPSGSEVDGDGDGYLACDDCADADPTRSPAALEACDGVDRDCNGVVDDLDADGDGAGTCPGTAGGIDVLVIVGDGPDAAAVQGLLSDAGSALRQALQGQAVSARVVVMAADGTLLGGPWNLGGSGWVARWAETTRPELRQGSEATPVLAATAALTVPGWRRPGAAVAVLVAADRDDHTSLRLDEVDRLLGGVGGTDDVRVSVLSGGWKGCSGFRATPRLAGWAALTGGVVASACDASWLSDLVAGWLPPSARDCDDSDPLVHPRAQELCNDVDDDCDGVVNEDGDGDGFEVCEGDCDDRVAAIHPGAVERCNGLDDDCDGQVPAVERDVDRDGYATCEGDCADGDASRHPGLVEICGDGVDRDCSGDDGQGVDGLDVDGDGFTTCEGDCRDDDPTTFPAAPEHRFDGVDNDCDALVDGEDPDEVVVIPAGQGSVTLSTTGSPFFTFCGKTRSLVTVTNNGLVLMGRSPTVDKTPTVEDLERYAPAAAVGWAPTDSDAWTDGPFLGGYGASGPVLVVRRPGRLTVVQNGVPYLRTDDRLTTAAVFADESLVVAVQEGTDVEDTLVGYACGDEHRVTMVQKAAPSCFDLLEDGSGYARLLDEEALPLVVTTECP
ncbi:MAG: putative metal-binding motif-containing protein [Alphaproteobacteria bacterium]|nr:putative metal-binding motif-containing protein [Alphaproteobacteria bacterium]